MKQLSRKQAVVNVRALSSTELELVAGGGTGVEALRKLGTAGGTGVETLLGKSGGLGIET